MSFLKYDNIETFEEFVKEQNFLDILSRLQLKQDTNRKL